MSYAAILTHVQATPEGEARLQFACDLAETLNAAVMGVGAEAIPPAPYAGPEAGAMIGDWVVAMRETIQGNLKRGQDLFTARTHNMTHKPVWRCGLRVPDEALTAAARGADLIVAGHRRAEHFDPYVDIDIGRLVIAAGRPVLVSPADMPALSPKRILVAWKDTREARRVLADAMPFLTGAEDIALLALTDADGAADANIQLDEVAAAIRRHGASASIAIHVVADRPADGHEILRQASRFTADLVVAGAYGHSRLGEWVFGGVTRDLLQQNQIHVLLSH